MKRICKNIVISTHLFDHPDLSVVEKWVLVALDSVSEQNGIVIGSQGISSITGIPTKEIKEILKSLQSKGALEVRIDEDGSKRIFVYLWKERYLANPNEVVVGDSPTDRTILDYDNIQEQWNTICTMLPKLTIFTASRKQKTRTCLKGASANEDDLIKAFRLLATSLFLNGSKGNGWSATYDWLIKSPQNLTKVLEGNYHKDYNERSVYESIMRGENPTATKDSSDDYYR